MLRFSKKKMYAVEAVLDIAFHSAEGPVQAGEIAARQDIPPRYLEQVLQNLVRSGILKGVRGPKGGYMLGRTASEIKLADIVLVVRAMNAKAREPMPPFVSRIGQEIVKPLAETLDQKMFEVLADHTVETLLAELDEEEAVAA